MDRISELLQIFTLHGFLATGLIFLGLYFLIFNLSYGFFLALSWIKIHRTHRMDQKWGINSQIIRQNPYRPWVSVIIPAYNEQGVIYQSIHHYLNLNYDRLEIIIVDDGSQDGTFELVKKAFALKTKCPTNVKITHFCEGIYKNINIKLAKKKNQGKASALNLGISLAQGEFVITADADTLPHPDSALRMLYAFLDPEVMAVGGAVKILNGFADQKFSQELNSIPDKPILVYQLLEYLRAFYCGRIGLDHINGTTLLSGAFTMFRKEALQLIGGYAVGSLTEDLEIIVRMRKIFYERSLKCKIELLPMPLCWTEVPENFKHLSSQRLRWQRGLLETLSTHKSMIGEKGLGVLGQISLPYLFWFEALGPLFELLGYVFVIASLVLGVISLEALVPMIGLGICYSFTYTTLAIMIEQHYFFHQKMPRFELGKLLFFTFFENLGVRQFFWFIRLRAFYAQWMSQKTWGAKERYLSFTPNWKSNP